MARGLEGKFFLHSGDEYYQTGKIVERMDDILLIEIDYMGSDADVGPTSLHAIHLEEIISEPSDKGGFETEWQFFRSRKDLNAYMAWLHESVPEGPKVVKLDTTQKKMH